MRRKLIIRCLVFLMFSGISFLTKAQEVNLKAIADTNAMRIGEQIRLELELTYPANVLVNFPAVADTFQGFEVVERGAIDTTTLADGNLLRKQKLILTSFDSGFHVIPPFDAIYQGATAGDTLLASSSPILITVNTVQVDTTKAIRDIKDLVRYPYTWQDAVPYVGGGLLAILIGWLIYYFIRHRKQTVAPVPVAPPVPPHQKALETLRAIESQKLWQAGKYKLYHTLVTDAVRVFIQDTRQVNAPDMTTNELLNSSAMRSLSDEQIRIIKQLLEYADLVKFAKMIPVQEDNEASMRNAVRLIESDQPVEKKEVIVA